MRSEEEWTYLAPVACLSGPCVRLKLALDDVGELSGPAIEARELHLGVRGALSRITGPLVSAHRWRHGGQALWQQARWRCVSQFV